MPEKPVAVRLDEFRTLDVEEKPAPFGTAKRWPVVISPREARDVLDEIVSAVVARNDPPRLFRRAGQLVEVARSDSGVGVAHVVESDRHLGIVSSAIDAVKVNTKGSPISVRPPRDLLSSIVAEIVAGGHVPILAAVTSAPIMRQDGSLIADEGHDPESRSYYMPAPGFEARAVPTHPRRHDAEAALDRVMSPFADIPFATETDRTHFIALLLTCVLRHWFPTIPIWLLEAPIQGSGKTLLAMAIRAIVEGAVGIGAAPETGADSDAEWRKRITAELSAAPSVCVIDNVKGTLGGGALAALATSPTWRDRILGQSVTRELVNSATWIFTSNNAAVDADLIRRTVFIRLDPRSAAPHLRTGFAVPDLIDHLLEHRAEILAGLHTLVRFWIQAGRPAPPAGTPSLGSFEQWSRIVPGILGAVGGEGFLGDLDERAHLMRDPDDLEAGEFLAAWWGLPGLRERTTARAIVDEALSGRERIELPASVQRDHRAPASGLARSLTSWIRFRRDRLVTSEDGARYVIRAGGGSSKRGLRWTVETAE